MDFTKTNYSCVTIIDKLTGQKHSPQAGSPTGGVARGHARAARERRREYERRERTGELAKISNMSSSKADILHINESKLDSTVRDDEVYIPGFDMSEKIVESPREKGEGGGGGEREATQ